ncbi:MAG: cytochrome c oxidase subunit II [Bacteroidetes bacterium]|nr:cytochrome c oxidase subunit II [Bacteroidota bacterium]
MTILLVIISIILIAVIIVQIGKVTELAAKIRGEEEMQYEVNRSQGGYMILFLVVFLIGCVVSAVYFKNYMLGYGPHLPASEHGSILDKMFNVTLFFTGIVFVITHILLFYFSWKYSAKKGKKALFIPHDNKLEIIWTAIPAVVMTFLVVGGLDAWNEVMADVSEDDKYLEIEATGFQFGWNLRYPGADGLIGEKNYKLISSENPLGQNWKDEKNLDDFLATELVLPVGQKVRVRITAQDVLHNFYLPHFRVKMDAIPGMPTYFVFTPSKTTEEYRQELKKYPEYNVPDPADPSKMLWETFEYELACAELCGRGHYSMKRPVKIVSQEEYDTWLTSQSSYYLSNIRFKESDPWTDKLFDTEVTSKKEALNAAFVFDNIGKELPIDALSFKGDKEFSLTGFSKDQLALLAEVLKSKQGSSVNLSVTIPTENDMLATEAKTKLILDVLYANGVNSSQIELSPVSIATEDNTTTKWVFTLLGAGLSL